MTRERVPSALERAFYGANVTVHQPENARALGDLLALARREKLSVVPAGNGAHAGVTDPPLGGALVVSSHRIDRTAAYEPDDFTIGVEAGMTCRDLRATLREHGQEVGLDFARISDGTVGGFVSLAPWGPRQGYLGPPAAHVIGVEGMSGYGATFRSGGMVVKNVAGYALDKFLVGALGRAGFLLRVNFKLRPLPARRVLRLVGFDDPAAAWSLCRNLRKRRLEPSALCVVGGAVREDPRWSSLPLPSGAFVVAATFEGREPVVAWQEHECGLLVGSGDASPVLGSDEAERFLDLATTFLDPDVRHLDTHAAVRASVLPSRLGKLSARVHDWFADRAEWRAAFCADANTGMFLGRWDGPVEAIDAPVSVLRDAAQTYEGFSRVVFLPPSVRRSWAHGLDPDPNATLAKRVLGAFDPDALFVRLGAAE